MSGGGEHGGRASPTLADTLFGIELPRASGARTGSLVVLAGEGSDIGTHALVGPELVLGRGAPIGGTGAPSSGTFELRDGRASRRHARVFARDGAYLAEDLGSTNGTSLNGERLLTPTLLADGDRIGIGSTVVKFTLVDETEAAWLDRMARLAGTDPLTGLHAKHRFDSLLEQALRVAVGTGMPVTVMMLDMDGVKRINDTHGHRYGAALIGAVGALLGQLLAGRGEACRFGGDEFCAYLPGAGVDVAQLMAERVRAGVEELSITIDDVQVRATVSVGVHEVLPAETPGAAVAAADSALYRAKASGKNRVST